MSEPVRKVSEESLSALEARCSAGTYKKRELTITHGEGVWVFDDRGRRYLDGIAGIGANVLGHCHPAFTAALHDQLTKTISVPELLCNDVRAQYQEELLSLFSDEYNRVFLCNSGAEANEAALKFARVSSGKTPIVSVNFGYHGKTLGALSVTHNIKYREPFEPLYPHVTFLPSGQSERIGELFAEESLHPGAFIFEAIQGEGGVREQDGPFVKELVAKVQNHGGYVIADEVQCGFGRSGEWWGHSRFQVTPDFIVLGKAIGNGVPLSAVIIHKRVPEFPPLAHTTTFGGNPLACRAGRAVLQVIQEQELLQNVHARGEQFRENLRAAKLDLVRELRGDGLMIGVELKQKAGKYLSLLQEEGVLALLAGPRVLRVLPSYVISEQEMETLSTAFISVLSQ
ncbi:MAG: aspartate aminotransferase family protein [Bdellovibrionales bacterium]|nr:aspartate aminotransferase family protein [Bdellovibrionales bacterium]